MKFKLSDKIKECNRCKEYPQVIIHIKEFIRLDWQLTNHFLWDLFRKWEIDEDVIEKEITKLSDKKDKLSGFSDVLKGCGEPFAMYDEDNPVFCGDFADKLYLCSKCSDEVKGRKNKL